MIASLTRNYYIGSFRSLIRSKNYYCSRLPAQKAGSHKRRAREKNVYGSFTQEEIDILFYQSEYKCYWCGTYLKNKTFHIDHHIPISLGGPNIIENINISCAKCNLTKSAIPPEQYAKKIRKIIEPDRENIILYKAGLNKQKYQNTIKQYHTNFKPLIIKIRYLAKINSYALMFNKFDKVAANFFSLKYQEYGRRMYFSHYKSSPGQNIWLICESIFDDIYQGLSDIDNPQINFEWVYSNCETDYEQTPSQHKRPPIIAEAATKSITLPKTNPIEKFSIEIQSDIYDEIIQYSQWKGFKNISELVVYASTYVFKKDKEWQSFLKEKNLRQAHSKHQS